MWNGALPRDALGVFVARSVQLSVGYLHPYSLSPPAIESTMLTILSCLVLLLVIILVACQSAAVGAFAWTLLRRRSASLEQGEFDGGYPKAAIILSLRGPDPYLDGTLEALKKLDYPDYQIHLVVDSETDPVWADIKRGILQSPNDNIEVKVLKNPTPHVQPSNAAHWHRRSMNWIRTSKSWPSSMGTPRLTGLG